MRVVCDNCNVSYEFDAAQIPEGGYEAKCKSCNHVFFVVPEPEVAHVTVNCNHCGAVYQFSSAEIPEGGYDAQCTQCQKVFFVSNNSSEPNPNSASIIPKAPPVLQAEPEPVEMAESFTEPSDRPQTMELDPIEVSEELETNTSVAPVALEHAPTEPMAVAPYKTASQDADIEVEASIDTSPPDFGPTDAPAESQRSGNEFPNGGGDTGDGGDSGDDETALKSKRPTWLLAALGLAFVGVAGFVAYTFVKPKPQAPPAAAAPTAPAAAPAVAAPAPTPPAPAEATPSALKEAPAQTAPIAQEAPSPMQKGKKGLKAKRPGKAKGKQKRARP